MASQRMVNGRRALRVFEAHIQEAVKESQSPPPAQRRIEAEGLCESSRFLDLTHQQIGERIALLKGKWFKKDGSIKSSGRCGSAVEFAREVADVTKELQELKAEFQRRLREAG